MKGLTLLLALLLAGLLVGCSQPEPPADTSGVVPADQAPPMDGSAPAGGGGSTQTSDTTTAPETGP